MPLLVHSWWTSRFPSVVTRPRWAPAPEHLLCVRSLTADEHRLFCSRPDAEASWLLVYIHNRGCWCPKPPPPPSCLENYSCFSATVKQILTWTEDGKEAVAKPGSGRLRRCLPKAVTQVEIWASMISPHCNGAERQRDPIGWTKPNSPSCGAE